jgi:L-asparagine transporter-like permease
MTEDLSNSPHEPEQDEKPLFPHPPWMVGVVLIIAILAILAGFSDPIWLLLGAPFIIVLVLFIYVRIAKRNGRSRP